MHPLGVLFAVAAAASYAVYLVLTRMISFVDSSMTSRFYVCFTRVCIPPIIGLGGMLPTVCEYY